MQFSRNMDLRMKVRLALLAAAAAAVLLLQWVGGGRWRADAPSSLPAPPPAAGGDGEGAIRFLEARVRQDPEEHAAQSRLAGLYLRRAGRTGSRDDLALAFRAARASLRSVPASHNTGGLTALAQAELATHAFAEARDHAVQLTRLAPGRSAPYQILGDALLEMGDYGGAASAFAAMARRGDDVGSQARLARLALLRGDAATARRRLETALALALDLSPPPRETIAWCQWQLGETAFSTGDYASAERHGRAALATDPACAPALAALGRVRAARGDLRGAITYCGQAARLRPDDVSFMAALGDLYQAAAREEDARKLYARVEQIGRQDGGDGGGARFGRELALFYADHDRNVRDAYANARREYEQQCRRDIYGADALAWTALKAGRVAEAQTAIKAALRLGTQDARLFYHAGMIARAGGDNKAARDYLKRALDLNPRFDPLQAAVAREALESGTAASAAGPSVATLR